MASINPEKTWKIVELILAVLSTVVALVKRSFPVDEEGTENA